MPSLGELFNGYALALLWLIVGTCFGAMAIPFGIVWLVLVSAARRWPDGDSHREPEQARRHDLPLRP